MTAPSMRPGDFGAVALGAAAGLLLAFAGAPFAQEAWSFARRGFEAALVAFGLC